MASITAYGTTSSMACAALLPKASVVRAPSAIGLPVMSKMGRVKCSGEEKSSGKESKLGMSASLMAAACAATMSNPAIALVDERMSTEGTGLPFGLSNNLLVWIILGVFALIWSFYIVYTSGLEEDEESGLSL
ncbi:OLC1v1007140C1 [Oldenlandia corymbosa var. corymbosa]|uniref:PSII 6.1 kDa protein n=1 Tax=Oldenlandia corymbosa var. corymbosa TaxID=529605 RepID=A0AAV1DJ01_OLDCO|nr:OLC1v1007140C1 [Oldenlandia corymbosa var. corymbosa]